MSLVNGMWRGLGVALGLAALSGCATGPALLCPKQGGPEWTRIESRNLVVFSDLPVDDARELTSELEQSLHALEQAAFTRTKPRPARTNVVALRHERSYRAVMPGRSVGAFARRLPGDLEASPTLLLWGELGEEARRIFLHELTHELFARNFGPSPVWMNEGWAEYYSTLELENGRILLGTPAQPMLFSTEPRAHWVTLEDKSRVVVMPIDRVKLPSDLFELSYGSFYRGTDTPAPTQGDEDDEGDQDQKQLDSAYLGAWALMHMLHDGVSSYSQRFARFGLYAQQASVRDAWQKPSAT